MSGSMSGSSSAPKKPLDCLRTRVCAYARDTCASTRKRVHREGELITCLTPPAGLGALGPQRRRLQPLKPSDSQIPCGCPAATALAPQARSHFCLCAATLPRPQTPLPVRAYAVTIVASALGAASAVPDMHVPHARVTSRPDALMSPPATLTRTGMLLLSPVAYHAPGVGL